MEIQRQSKNLIFSYQGAFGPPTYGHYQSMLFFSRMIQEYIEDKEYNVTMLFMPTAISGSKKHLQPTQDLRIETLKIFCEKLGREFNDPRFSFDELINNLLFDADDIVEQAEAELNG